MSFVVLVVESVDAERLRLRQALSGKRLQIHEVREAVDAMGTIGRADFKAVIASEGKRQLSLRGLFALARRKHPGIHLVLRGRPGSEHEVKSALGADVQLVPLAMQPRDVVELVVQAVDARARGATPDFDDKTAPMTRPSDDDSDLDVDVEVNVPAAAPQAKLPPPKVEQPAKPTKPTKPKEATPLFEGELSHGASAVLLMGVFAQDLTGVLEVTGGAAGGKLYFFAGEPVAATQPDGDVALREMALKKGLVPEGFQVSAPEGQLVSKLIEHKILSGEAVNDLLRDYVRERVLAFAMQESGSYRFLEDKEFVKSMALVKVNPFGLIFEARRRRTPPTELLRRSAEIGELVVVQLPALRIAAPKLRQFVRGQDLREPLSAPRTVKELLESIGLDPLLGTLVVMTLDDARLVELVDEPPDPAHLPSAREGERSIMSLPEAEPVDDDSHADRALREEIFSLYMQLKPLTAHEAVLGVAVGAGRDALDRAYMERMRVLDPARVPESSVQRVLLSRIEELREKVRRAYDALR